MNWLLRKIVSVLPWFTASTTIAATHAPAVPAPDDQADAHWQQVYSARQDYFVGHIGELPEDILKIGHMFGVWPGGGLYVIPARKIGADAWVYTTFGFTNPDMPASTTVSDVATEADDLGRITETTGTLRAKSKAEAAPGAAGYGYELFVLTRDKVEWPLWILQWTANAEILNDAGILDRVNKYGGLTIDGVQVGESESVNLLIAKARKPLPTGSSLPNGTMELLVATVITDEEMRWSMEHGREALLEKLVAEGVGQLSVRGRPSVIK
jgi:hypothetical protein